MHANRLPGPRRPRTQLVSEHPRPAYRTVQTRDLADTFIGPPQGRLTLTSGAPIMTSDVSAGTAIYYALYKGAYYPRFNGDRWSMRRFSELPLNLDGDSGHTGYHQSGKLFDLLLDDTTGSPRLVSGPAWASDTTRSAALTQTAAGFKVNNASMLVRYGANSGDTAIVGAGLLTWVGTFRASADGQTAMVFLPNAAAGGTSNKLYLANAYNEEWLTAVCRDSADSWNENDDTWKDANQSASNRVSFVACREGVQVRASHMRMNGNSGTASSLWSVGLNSSSPASGALHAFNSTALALAMASRYEATLSGEGHNYIQAINRANNAGGGQGTFYGDAGDAARYQAGLIVSVKM
ncbi:hypothetical protein [Hyphomicrobium sp.]|uniref:hypothetical protein n=1 Tax=Hyphomicrobium sp. TaxID=82 RepID=UPI001323D146|nr:hypothetical protein [Hyphomicrobium sp.]KAB2937404.1 MAG: hypothetical protein F9K20_20140 [Hyphomicrobium sp.]